MSSLPKVASMVAVCLVPFTILAADPNDSVSQAVVVADHHPLSFELNQGQAAQAFDYVARGRGYTVLVNRDSATVLLPNKSNLNPTVSMVRISLLGARPQATVRPLDPLLTRTNYLIGNDTRHWKTNVPNYGRVSYAQVYPGTDLVYYGSDGELEFDFAVAPGADPHAIRLAIEGAKALTNANGDVVLRARGTQIVLRKPRLYQFVGGNKQPILGHYEIDRRNAVRFMIGAYDRGKQLVIDPVLAYSTLLGGWGIDVANAVAVDGAGYTYLTGETTSIHFPTTPGAFDSTCGTDGACNFGNNDAFVAKLTSHGTRVWVTYIGGGRNDVPTGIAVDATGHAYITGWTSSPAYPASPLSGAPPLQTNFAFVTKFNQSGSALAYSVRFCSACAGDDLALSSTGEAFVVGTTGPNLLTTSSALQPTPPPCSGICTDGFVAKLNAAGTALLYSTFLGGNDEDEVRAIAVDSSGDAYVTGLTSSDDFPITPGSFQQSKPPGFAGFVSKLNSSGSALMYSTFFVGSRSHDGIALDGAGNAYITGLASAGLPTTPFAYQQTVKGIGDAYVTKFNASGSSLVYSTYVGGSDEVVEGERALRIAVNGSGEAYIAGTTYSTDFPTTVTAFQRVKRSSNFDASCFITKFNSTGSALSYSSYMGGSDGGQYGSACTGIALGKFGNVYVSGSTISSDFPTTPDAFMKTNTAGDVDAFAVQIMPLCPLKAGNLTVTICKPGNGTSVTSPVTIMAGTRDTLPVKLIEIFVDGIKVYQAKLAAIMVRWPMSAGTHRVTVRARDYVNQPFSASVNVSVGP